MVQIRKNTFHFDWMLQHVWVTYIWIFHGFFKAHEVLNKILKNQDDTIRNSILVTWYSLMELPIIQNPIIL